MRSFTALSIRFANTKALRFELKPSNYCAAILFLQHICVLLILFLIPLPWIFLISIAIVCLWSLSRTLNGYAWHKSDNAVRTLIVCQKEWRLLTSGQHEFKATLQGHSYSSRYLIVLNFQLIPDGKITIILMRDSLDTDSWRQLRAYLAFAG